MKKAMVLEPGRLGFVELPEPPVGPGQVKIRTRLSGLSARSEVERYARNYAGQPEEIGYNLVGRIEEVGAEVSDLRAGDRVFAGIGHAAMAVIDADRAIKIPDGVDDESACFAYLPTLGTHALRLADYQPGEIVAISGQGIIGQTAGLVGRMFGARTIAIDVSDERLALARQAGAHLTVNPRSDDVTAAVAAFCGDAGLDIVIETASNWHSVAQALDLVRHRGRVVLLGILRDPLGEAEAAALFGAYRRNMHAKELAIIGASNDPHDPRPSHGVRFTRNRNIDEVLFHLADGSLNLRQLITHRYPIGELEAVYQRLIAGQTDHLGVVFEWPAVPVSA
ncbi:MAG: zinc-dependent alcohol dehydrogenase [Thermomicrobiales bacterium]